MGNGWHIFADVLKSARRTLEVLRVVMLTAGLVTVPILNANASASHDDLFSSHIVHAAGTEGGHHAGNDHHADGGHHDVEALPDDSDAPQKNTETLCCEDIGLCSVGLVLPEIKRASPLALNGNYGLPANAAPWLHHVGRPDGPPPRSQS